MNISDAIKLGGETLRQSSVAEPEREVNLLLRHSLKRDATFIYSHPEYRLDAVESILFKAVLKRRAAGEPFQYISGVQEFYGHEFKVTPDVLIPRPETEILVEAAIGELKGNAETKFCEIGVGSGCISISILKAVPSAIAVAVDLSKGAIDVAKANAEKHDVLRRLNLLESDIFSSINDADFDLIVSNPPYIPMPDIETLQKEVREFEPRMALDGGRDGLDTVRKIINEAPNYLRSKGRLLVEIGWDQAESVNELFQSPIWHDVRFHNDLQGIPRVVDARLT
ncbi:MAG: peptide chain release factor N(5)-glutamine methyltransferase [Acidobacteria bacterium]|nr:MAG: peptide chain release factor N(5)-glutamine methyltransferase [Acidobacteriota bacterium]